MNIVYTAIRGAGGMAVYVTKVFAICVLALHFLYTFVIAATCFLLAYEGSLVQGILAGIVGFALAVVAASLVIVNLTIAFSIRKLLRDAKVGERVFNHLFEIALGIAEDQQTTAGLTRQQAEDVLNSAASKFLKEPTESDGTLGGKALVLSLWIAAKIQRMLVKVTVRIAIAKCGDAADPDGRIDLRALRDRLAGTIDTVIAEKVNREALRYTYVFLGIAAGLSVLLARAIAWLPL